VIQTVKVEKFRLLHDLLCVNYEKYVGMDWSSAVAGFLFWLQLRTRAVTLPGHISTAQQLFQAADQLLRPELPFTARLIGIRCRWRPSFEER
jgi:hypothetical protein